jgi:hypothetical protein
MKTSAQLDIDTVESTLHRFAFHPNAELELSYVDAFEVVTSPATATRE